MIIVYVHTLHKHIKQKQYEMREREFFRFSVETVGSFIENREI